ncbi:MAG: hypothetical protein HYY40_05305 [Bacteroidetes bacterium]|nr:hypothetical protein [Bacteroidota bacterium]
MGTLKRLLSSLLFFYPLVCLSQTITPGEIHSDIQVDAQYYRDDSAIGATSVPENILMNSYLNLLYSRGPFSGGLRYEAYLNSIQGYDTRYSGKSGIPYRFISFAKDELSVTAGNFYEQFGSGMILRSYEDKGLGLDNSFDGVRLQYRYNGLQIKTLAGKQRFFFSLGPGIVRGIDTEVSINEFIPILRDSSRIRLILGGSFVSKYQTGTEVVYLGYNLAVPRNVGAWSARGAASIGKLNLSGEYCYKINDPGDFNRYIYKPGTGLLLTANYSGKGFGIFFGAKRIDNMSYKSDRTALGTDLNINYLPALTKQHTYSLLAYYPYATQPNGEIGFQSEINYKFPKGTLLGGRYGTHITVNCPSFNGLDTARYPASDDTLNRLGYSSEFFGAGKLFFNDFNVEVNKKISSKLKLNFVYAYIIYNKDVVQNLSGYGTVYAHTGMIEGIYRLTSSHSLRLELEHLYTLQDDGSWAHFLAEWGAGEHFYIYAMDQYNYGNKKPEKRDHYFSCGITYIKSSTRISMAYGRQRQGYYCAGGVCRYIPASNGITLTVISSF